MNYVELINDLRNTSSRLDKEKLLKQCVDDPVWTKILHYTYNPYFIYGVSSIPQDPKFYSSLPQDPKFYSSLYGYLVVDEEDLFNNLFLLLDLLKNRELTGHAALKEIGGFIRDYEGCLNSGDLRELLNLIFKRNLLIGATEKTINKVYGYNLIPTFEVMLAKSESIEFPCWAEEKFDGVRILAFIEKKNGNLEVSFRTRNGLVAYFPNIAKYIKETFSYNIFDMVLEGEIIGKNRQSVSGQINKFLKGTAKLNDDIDFKYCIFDILTIDEFQKQECQFQIEVRRQSLIQFCSNMHNICEIVEQKWVETNEQLMEMYGNILANGGEGIIAKTPHSLYEFKRSSNWKKLKAEETIDLKCVDIVPGTGKRSGFVGSLVCENKDGSLCVNVGSGLSEEMLFEMNEESPVGKIIEVKYNMIIQNKNDNKRSLFLPRFMSIREDKTEAD